MTKPIIVKPRVFCSLLLIACTIVFAGCKRSDDSPTDNSQLPYARCRISGITFHGAVQTQTRYFTYDSAGRLKALRTLPQVYSNDINLNFMHTSAASVIVQHLDWRETVTGADTIFYDGAGRVQRISYPPAPDSKEYLRFFYSSAGTLDSVVRDIYFTISGMYLPVGWYYRWQDQNMVRDSAFLQGVIDYSYYPGTTAQGPEYDLANEYRILDRPYTRSQNLRKTLGDPANPLVLHTYAFDAGGKMIADTSARDANLQYEEYSYDCR